MPAHRYPEHRLFVYSTTDRKVYPMDRSFGSKELPTITHPLEAAEQRVFQDVVYNMILILHPDGNLQYKPFSSSEPWPIEPGEYKMRIVFYDDRMDPDNQGFNQEDCKLAVADEHGWINPDVYPIPNGECLLCGGFWQDGKHLDSEPVQLGFTAQRAAEAFAPLRESDRLHDPDEYLTNE